MQAYAAILLFVLSLTSIGLLLHIHTLKQKIRRHRQQTELNSRESELRLRTALLASRQALFDIDLRNGEIAFSPEFAAISCGKSATSRRNCSSRTTTPSRNWTRKYIRYWRAEGSSSRKCACGTRTARFSGAMCAARRWIRPPRTPAASG